MTLSEKLDALRLKLTGLMAYVDRIGPAERDDPAVRAAVRDCLAEIKKLADSLDI